MKNAIILANLGNRNITIRGDSRELKVIASERKQSFREYTKELVETQTPDQWAESLELRILPPLLDKYRDEAQVVFLFYTKQDDLPEGKPDNDTEFSAILVAELISRQWGLEAKLIRVDCIPVDVEALMSFYRRQLLELEATYPDARWVVADAGGTTQQKSALKLVGEFLVHGAEKFAEKKLRFYQIDEEKDGSSSLKLLPQNQFRKSLNILQALALIDVGYYKAADRLLADEYLSPILTYLDMRLAGFKSEEEHSKFKSLIQDGKYKKWKTEEFNLIEQIEALPELRQAVATRHLQPALERLQAAQFYMKVGMSGDFLMALMHFAEHLACGVFKVMAGVKGDDLKKNHKGMMASPKFSEWKAAVLAQSNFAREIEEKQKTKNEEFHFGFAFDLAAAHDCHYKPIADICRVLCEWSFDDLFRPNIVPLQKSSKNKRKDLRALRNSFAHEGIRLDFDEIEDHIPHLRSTFGEWPALLGLPKENYYLRANRRLKQHLRQLRN
jgi:hypothetical protein